MCYICLKEPAHKILIFYKWDIQTYIYKKKKKTKTLRSQNIREM